MQRKHYLQDDSTELLQTTVWRLNFSKLVFELLHLTQKIEPLHYPCVHLKQTIPNDDSLVCMCVFSAACNLDSGKSSNPCHNLPVLLLLSRHSSLAVAVLLPHLRKNSAPIHGIKHGRIFNIEARKNQMQPQSCLILWRPMVTVTSWKDLESRKSISKQRKRQKAPASTWISATLSFSCCT